MGNLCSPVGENMSCYLLNVSKRYSLVWHCMLRSGYVIKCATVYTCTIIIISYYGIPNRKMSRLLSLELYYYRLDTEAKQDLEY